MSFVQDEASPDLAIKHWKTYLDSFKPCHFPALLDGLPDHRQEFQETTVKLEVDNGALLDLCSRHHLTPRSVIQVAWAIVIGCYAGVEDVCFAYLANVGGLSDLKTGNILICHAQITAENLLLDTMGEMMRNFKEASTSQKCSPTVIRKLLGLGGQIPFNSGLQIPQTSASEVGQETEDGDLVEVLVQSHMCLISVQNMALTQPYSAIFRPAYRLKTTLPLQCLSVHVRPSSLPIKQPMSSILWKRRWPKP